MATRMMTTSRNSPTAKAGTTSLSLVDLIAPPEQTPIVRAPPGLEFSEQQSVKLSPSGLPKVKICISLVDEIVDTSSDCDDTSAGSGYASSEAESDSSSGLVLEEVSSLNVNSPSFVPMLAPAVANVLMPDVAQRTPLRKLNSKAVAYVPKAMQAW
eukprot:CAMPEP_0169115332 /NCGR_PEP_ID=MMETSP1015-20121227/29280_1 /TAXON_ID=342587 /ORGANISM="Karlodinium micrum, Strain CCMP2283" /LENGTH=155 /DNA_ID=CAMNT_0009177765 /DNA_START=55 /DNA_END=519 /DNA_ORIENTATION=+